MDGHIIYNIEYDYNIIIYTKYTSSGWSMLQGTLIIWWIVFLSCVPFLRVTKIAIWGCYTPRPEQLPI